MFKGTQTLVRGRGTTRWETQLEIRRSRCSSIRAEMEYRGYSRKPADSTGKGIGRQHCHGGIQSSPKQNHITHYFSSGS